MSRIDVEQCAVVVLAAGKGSRMLTQKAKVMHTLLGEPMLLYVLKSLRDFCFKSIFVVVGKDSSTVQAACKDFDVQFVVQEKPLGTGDAVCAALPYLKEMGIKDILIVNGDSPLFTPQFFSGFLKETIGSDVAFATQEMPMTGSYGRVVRKNGDVSAIIEAKDFEQTRHGELSNEINVGVYLFSLNVALNLLPKLSNINASDEYYITDVVQLAIASDYVVKGIMVPSHNLVGVNTVRELVEAEGTLQKNITEYFLDRGVVLHFPESIRIGPFVSIEPGAEIHGPCELYGHTYIDSDVVIHSHCWIKDTKVLVGSKIYSFSHLEKAYVGKGCLVGPYARLRPKATLEEQVHIGNFVEVKNVQMGVGAKANHLSYLGDADVGAFSNIGAGTITCNYDGELKHKTIIGEKAFIGSNTAIVAPVSIGDNSCVGAGSVITENVPENMLAIGRGQQYMRSRNKNKFTQPIEK